MKTAYEVLRQIALTVQPPKGEAIVIEELAGVCPNWEMSAERLETAQLPLYTKLVADLKASDPMVDWSAEPYPAVGRRRIARWLSELDG